MKNINEIDSQWLGACGLNPFHIYDSSGRTQMVANHLGQKLVINGADERWCQTGMEREYGKYTFRVEMPVDGQVLDIIERYPYTHGIGGIDHNPQTVIVYEDLETKEVGIINLVDYCSNHQYFGFRYKTKEGLNRIQVGAQIAKGTVFLDSPAITDHGGYAYGINANVAFMTHPAAAEDGVVVSDTFLPKLGFRTYETRIVDWGKKSFALNTYGDDANYQPFPDIGQEIRSDGLLMALRDYEPHDLAVVEQSRKATGPDAVDFTFDSTIYANGPGGKVIDIKIHHDLADYNHAKCHMDSQAQKYDKARRVFYGRIMANYKRLMKVWGDNPPITPEFHQLVMQAQSVLTEGGKIRVNKQYRKAPLDIYRVEFIIEYNIVPSRGFKLTDIHGTTCPMQ